MGLVQMSNGEGSVMPKRPAELNQHIRDEQKVRGGVTGEGQELSAEDESRINDNIGDEDDGRMEVLKTENCINQADLIREGTQQHTQGPLVRWERFLPVRSLKVLLVENDDATRNVLFALLRNCGYEVVAVVNGLQAWKVLEDLTANIDLVLTEVVLLGLTGIGLLSKIMGHKTCRNIPVIMMSSHDSVSVVFKCLSKGAVDFLVKPIRKNELKNLWQHVWRKCNGASGSGSGSESCVRTQKSLKSESGEHSDNKCGNYDEDDIGSTGLNARDRSDNGSGTQNSWTKMEVEVDSPGPMSPWEQLGDPPAGSTCTQAIHSMPDTIPNNPLPATKDGQTQHHELALDMVTDIDLKIAVPRSIPALQPREVPGNLTACNNKKTSEKEKMDKEHQTVQVIEINSSTERSIVECKNQGTDPTGVVTNSNSNSDAPLEIQVLNNSNGMVSNVKDMNNVCGNKEVPSSFEVGSKSLNGMADLECSAQDQNILKQSDRSAFSRYISASHQAPTGNVGSCLPFDNSSEAAKTESAQGIGNNYFNSIPPNQHSNGSNNNNDMGSTTSNNAFTKPNSEAIDKPKHKSAIKYLQPSSAFQPLQNVSPQPVVAQENGDKQHIEVQHHHHHHLHHHHHMHNMVAHQPVNHNGRSLRNKIGIATSLRENSTNPLSSEIKTDAANQSINGSSFGSHHGSNIVHVGNNATLLGRAGNSENDNRKSEKEVTTSGLRFEAPNAAMENQFSQREAALNKFRQKRKERCFEKKVRYQSRKKLAEQRPRVRGQFVRHAVDENKEKYSHQ